MAVKGGECETDGPGRRRFLPRAAAALVGLIGLVGSLVFAVVLTSCRPNNPYPDEKNDDNTYYGSFLDIPKTFDPAKSYTTSSALFLYQIVEPPLQYHYLKRPYKLIPLTVEKMPVPKYYDRDGKLLSAAAPVQEVARAVYEFQLKKGIKYQPHPCFAKNPDGTFRWHGADEKQLKGLYNIQDFPVDRKDTRELVAADYVLQIKRMADKRLQCPIFSTLSKYIKGYREYAQGLSDLIDAEREKRKKRAGPAYNASEDEKKHPLKIDYDAVPLSGVELVDRYRFRIILSRKYPQFRYWLAMSFFAPVPWEALEFYRNPLLIERELTLERWPVGTGPYRFAVIDRKYEIRLVRNENFHEERYPSEGAPGDRERGLLTDAGKKLPFLDAVVFKYEKEAIPRWHKFLQGYYDQSGITSAGFDSVVQFSDNGADLTPRLKRKGLVLYTSVSPSIYYWIFNMKDKVVGGLDEKKCKLRQAISIALDYNEYLQIFSNGRGIPAQEMLPPGIFGCRGGKEGVNPYTDKWDEKLRKPVRRSLKEARRLLAEAGYPNGVDPTTGKPLTLTFCNAWTDASLQKVKKWFADRFAKLGLVLKDKAFSYPRFQEMMSRGRFQVSSWGWHADYPDPENFLFLLYGPNGKVDRHGENVSNYASEKYDRVFEKLERMDNGPERQKLIDEAQEILRHDAPLCFGYYPTDFGLRHSWVGNYKSSPISYFTMKYRKIDGKLRREKRAAWNQPRLDVLGMVAVVFLFLALPAVWQATKRHEGAARRASSSAKEG